MTKNRNKLIDAFIANTATAIVHEILEEAANDETLRKYYDKEFMNSLSIAKKYREEINPADKPLKVKDRILIKEKIISKVRNELNLRISKGYKNLNTDKAVPYAEKIMKDLKIE